MSHLIRSIFVRPLHWAIALALASPLADATNFVVTNTNSAGDGSLAGAVSQANAAPGPHTITFAVAGVIAIPSTLTLARAMTITGPGPTPASLVLDGGHATRIINVTAGAGAPVKIENLTLRNAHTTSGNRGGVNVDPGNTLMLAECVLSGNTSTSIGAALANRGTVTVTNCTFDGNAGGSSGAAIYNQGSLTITGSTFTNNTAPNDGGAIQSSTGGTMTIADSTFADNGATANGGGGGAISNNGSATIVRSTFSGNYGVGYGGAIRADTSGAPSAGGLVIVNSTFSGNTGGSAAGAGGGAIAAVNAGTVRILNSTITANSAGSAAAGGGIYSISPTVVEISNSIVSGNVVAEGRPGPDCVGTLTSQGYNLVSNVADCTIAGTLTGNITGVDAKLAPLAASGGATRTHALLTGSPALDAGDPTGCIDATGAPLTTDQRGITRAQGVRCDIGAYEQATELPSGRFQGLFWRAPASSEAGWGINFAHQGGIIFATWFTYGFDGKPTWFAANLSVIAPGVYTGDVFTVTGPAFTAVPWDPATVAETAVGTMTVAFSDQDNGVLNYSVNGVAQTKTITRQIFASPVPVCTWGELVDLALATNFQDLWWAAPAGSEAGWGVNFTQQGNVIFATWFTYGANRKPLWLIATTTRGAPGVYDGPISAVTGPPFNAVPFNPATVVETEVGHATLTFAHGNHATFAYTVNGVTQSKAITRQVFAPPGTVCQ